MINKCKLSGEAMKPVEHAEGGAADEMNRAGAH